MKTRKTDMKHISMALAATFMLAGSALTSSCSSENELVVENKDVPQKQQAGTFIFRLVGTAGSSGTGRAVTDAGHDFESAVKTVYVAFFTKKADAEQSTLSKLYSYKGDGDDSNTITKAGDAFTIGDQENNKLLSGDFIVYFIANPGAELAQTLDAMTETTTVSAFKQFAIDAKDTPNGGDTSKKQDGTGFLMISDETEVTISSDDATSQIINLTRLAARFDIINTQPYIKDKQANGATITKVQINNEAIASDLIAPAATSKDSYIATTAEKNWEGDNTNDGDNMTLYTYENITTGSKNTSITITYTLGGDSQEKTLDIYLKEKATDALLGVKRNHLYSIYLNCVTGEYNLTVDDWKEGATVNLPNKDIYVEYTAADLGKIGDYVYNDNGTLAFSDGGLRKMYLNGDLDYEKNRPAPLADKTCIGIVFSNMTSEYDQGQGYKKGYAVSLKYSSNLTAFCSVQPDENISSGRFKTTTQLGAAIQDLDGLEHSRKLKELRSGVDYYPVLKTVEDYNVPLPAGTSEWYIPSIGQLGLLISNLSNFTALPPYRNSTASLVGKMYAFPYTDDMLNQLNGTMSQLGNGNYDPFMSSANIGQNYIASNVSDANRIVYMCLGYDNQGFIISGGSVITGKLKSRPVFAF